MARQIRSTAPVHLDGGTFFPAKEEGKKGRLRWRDGEGIRHDRAALTVEDAVRILSVPGTAAGGIKTIDDLGEAYLKRLVRGTSNYANAESRVRIHIRPVIGHVKVLPGEWTADESESVLIRAREAGLKPMTVQGIGATLRAMVTYAHRKRLMLGEDPMNGVKYTAPKTHRRGGAEITVDMLPEEDDIDRLIEGFHYIEEPRYAVGADLLRGSGLRFGEFVMLRPRDLDLKALTIDISRALQHDGGVDRPKGGRVRTAMFPARLVPALTTLCEATPPDGLLFYGKNPDTVATRGHFRYRWVKAAVAAGWEVIPPKTRVTNHKRVRSQPTAVQWSPHDLRHYFATWMLFVVRADLDDVSDLLGHASRAFTLERYVGHRPNMASRVKGLMDAA